MKDFILENKFVRRALAHKRVLALDLILTVSIVFAIEAMYRRHLSDTIGWLFSHLFLFSLNVATVLAILLLLQTITKNKYLGAILVFDLGLILGGLNAQKYALRNVPITLDDALLLNEVWALRDKLVNSRILVFIGFGLVVLGLVSYGLYRLYKRFSDQTDRVISSASLLLCIGILLIGQQVNDSDLGVDQSGFLYSLSNITRVKPIATPELVLEASDQIQEDIINYVNDEAFTASDVKPNVIVIMSEAFWDINKMGLKLKENPVPYFESLRNESIYGELYVPVVGGGTANTEFEVMTGMTVKNFSNDWFMAYPNEMKMPFPSLASIYRTQGYKSIALHPYMSWYYNRYDVYKNFGFDDFISLEYLGETDKFGSYTKDEFTFNKLLDLIETTEEPLFNYTVTMQNHGPYGDARFTDSERTLPLVDSLSPDANYFINNYIQGINYSDQALEMFIENLRNIDEPTMVVLFGDHLPMLGNDYLAYRDSGYIGDETSEALQEDLRIMSVPFIAWRNYSDESIKMSVMNASYLTPKIIEWSGAEIPDYLKAVSMLSDRLPVLMRTYALDINGDKILKDSEQYQKNRAIYAQIYQDLKVGNTTLNEAEWTIAENVSYNKDISDMVISSVEVDQNQMLLRGSDFKEDMILLINHEAHDYNFISEDEVAVDAKLETEAELQFVIKDTAGETTSVSNIYKWIP